MSAMPTHSSPDGTSPRLVCARQADPGLDRLLAVLLNARNEMQAELRSRPRNAQRQMVMRGRLLESLEAYTSGLSARRLRLPPRLRDELALQRDLAADR